MDNFKVLITGLCFGLLFGGLIIMPAVGILQTEKREVREFDLSKGEKICHDCGGSEICLSSTEGSE